MTDTLVKTNPFWVLLLISSFWLIGSNLSAQSCFDAYEQRDSINFILDLGDCEIAEVDILEEIGLSACGSRASITVSAVGIGEQRSVDLIDEMNNSIIDNFLVIVRSNHDFVPEVISYDLSPFDCIANKDFVLDQLNVVDVDAIRANIHFISGTSRITEFIIGDTTYIDRIVCGDGYTYVNDVKVFFGLDNVLPDNHLINHHTGFTTQKITLQSILDQYQYFNYSCDFNSYAIDHIGPFGYGLSEVGDLRLDEAYIAQGLQVNVIPPACPSSLLNFSLVENQCFLTKNDILDSLGFNSGIDDYSLVDINLKNGDSFENESFTIENIAVDGFIVCSQEISVSYTRSANVDIEPSSFACNDVLNISLGNDCSIMISSDILLETDNVCFLNFIVRAEDENGNLIAEDHGIILSEPGSYNVSITDPTNNLTCWTIVNIEDKHIFDVRCANDTIDCNIGLVPSDNGDGLNFPYLGTQSQFVLIEEGKYLIENSDDCGIKDATYKDKVIEECSGSYKEIIQRDWTFSDNAGNIDTCSQLIYVLKTPINQVDEFEIFEANCIEDFMTLDANGHPLPSESGVPTIFNGLYSADGCGNLKKTYSDNVFPLCGRSKKIIREWSIIDWCSDQIITRNQTIKIEDKEGPEINVELADIEVSSHPFLCGAENIELPQPDILDCGSDLIDIQVGYQYIDTAGHSVHIDNGTSFIIPFLSMEGTTSSYTVEYIYTDECSNVTRDSFVLSIIDNQPPVAVCDQHTAISIAGNGQAQLRAITFDDLSVDNCGIEKYEVRKMNGLCGSNEEFSEVVLFCCDEVGQTVELEFRVTDLAGNFNTCIVYVDVFDKFLPVIVCPDDITIDCSTDYRDLSITGEASAIDNCTIDSLYYDDELDLNECGKGVVKRYWKAKDLDNQEVVCEQVITVEDQNTFVMTSDRFPSDTLTIGCIEEVDPSFTGRPNLEGMGCSDVVATYEDTYFNNVQGACFKIIRDWIVIDWCEYSTSNPSEGYWRQAQAIKVQNNVAPNFIDLPSDTTICLRDEGCLGLVTMQATALDDCSNQSELDWFYEVLTDDENQSTIKTSTSSLLSVELEAGSYIVRYTVADGCDNYNRQVVRLKVIDCVQPLITCPAELITRQLDQNGQIVLFTDELNLIATDNCTSSDEILFSFSPDTMISSVVYDCQDIEDGIEQIRDIPVYAIDHNSNIAFCSIQLVMQDNINDICQDIVRSDTLQASGAVYTEQQAMIDEVQVSLSDDLGNGSSLMTDIDGVYKFENLDGRRAYKLAFEREGRADDGVTTLDLLLIQRHILGLGLLDTPYKIIAADIDNNERITGADLVQLRKIILGIDDSFGADQKSWRFVSTNVKFVNPYVPFPFKDEVLLNDISNYRLDLDIMGMKVGDVNGSNEVSSRFKSQGRHSKRSSIYLPSLTYVSHSDNIRIPVFGSDKYLYGIQLFMSIDNRMGEIYNIEGEQLDITSDNWIYNHEEGTFSLSWTTPNLLEIKQDLPLFYINIKSNDHLDINELFSIDENTQQSFIIDSELNESQIQLQFSDRLFRSENTSEFDLVKISPNPVKESSTVTINSKRKGSMKYKVYDATGIMLVKSQHHLSLGENRINLDFRSIANYKGILFIQFEMGKESRIEKIVKM